MPIPGVVASAVVVSTAYVISDNFNRADGALGSNWVQASGSVMSIASSKLASNGGIDHIDWTTPMPSDDHWVEADVSGALTGGQYIVVHGRGSGGKTNFYMGFLIPGGGVTIGKQVGGSYSDVVTKSFTHGVGAKLRLELQGSTQRLYVDGVLELTGSDTSITTGKDVGLNCNGAPATFDNFRAGSFPYTP